MTHEDRSELKAVRYTIELKQPVLATDVQGEPNGAVSLPYIPGSLLRGALVTRYLQTTGKKQFDASDDPEARALFLTEATRYLNAYPVDRDGRRALPVPAAWRFEKGDKPRGKNAQRRIYNLIWGRPIKFHEEAVGASFAWQDGNTAQLWSPPRHLNVHTQRDARKGRATEEMGSIYRYDAIAAGAHFEGVILTAEGLAAELETLLRDATFWIGRARRAGYGEVVVTNVNQPSYWRETGGEDSAGELSPGDHFQVVFTSDVLLRDEWGQATLDPRRTLERALGIQTGSLNPDAEHCFGEAKVVGGFNRKWALPLPQTVALAAGSIFSYQTEEAISADKLRDLEQHAIGERRAEGFGSVVVNWMVDVTGEIMSQRADLSSAQTLEKLSDEEAQLAQTVAQRMLRRRLDERLRMRINLTQIKRRRLTTSQIARLRVIIRDVQRGRMPGETVELTRLRKYLVEVRDRRAGEQLERARVIVGDQQQRLIDWLEAQLNDPEGEWAEISLTLGEKTVAVTATADLAISQEYTLRMIDQVLYRAAKQDNEG